MPPDQFHSRVPAFTPFRWTTLADQIGETFLILPSSWCQEGSEIRIKRGAKNTGQDAAKSSGIHRKDKVL